MRERLAHFTHRVSETTRPIVANACLHGARFWNFSKIWGGRAWRAASAAGRWILAAGKQMLLRMLLAAESTLLSAKGRERVHAVSVFALILALAVSSVDMLVTGGPELIPSARAATTGAPRIDLIAAASLRDTETTELADFETEPAPEESAAIEPVVLLAPSAAPQGEVTLVVDQLADAPAPLKASSSPTPQNISDAVVRTKTAPSQT